jgi:hypothetical protein
MSALITCSVSYFVQQSIYCSLFSALIITTEMLVSCPTIPTLFLIMSATDDDGALTSSHLPRNNLKAWVARTK